MCLLPRRLHQRSSAGRASRNCVLTNCLNARVIHVARPGALDRYLPCRSLEGRKSYRRTNLDPRQPALQRRRPQGPLPVRGGVRSAALVSPDTERSQQEPPRSTHVRTRSQL